MHKDLSRFSGIFASKVTELHDDNEVEEGSKDHHIHVKVFYDYTSAVNSIHEKSICSRGYNNATSHSI